MSPGGNSGIFFRVTEAADNTYETQLQRRPQSKGTDEVPPAHGCSR